MAVGLLLLAIYIAARTHSEVSSRSAIQAFKATQEPAFRQQDNSSGSSELPSQVSFSLWSANRISAYKRSLIRYSGAPLALLRIPKLRLEVPVFDGTDALTLNRGVGRIRGTAPPGGKGNIGIAGHRDGFFRGLKDIRVGDAIDLELSGNVMRYTVKDTKIVNPNDVEVLRDQSLPMLTLVTCYPFHYVGDAPLRYIVQASLLHVNTDGRGDTEPN